MVGNRRYVIWDNRIWGPKNIQYSKLGGWVWVGWSEIAKSEVQNKMSNIESKGVGWLEVTKYEIQKYV